MTPKELKAVQRHPEILDEKIEKPLIVASLPRTGSTIMHFLLAQDPDTRYLATWECNLLSPPPDASTYETDPRIAQWEKVMAGAHGSEVPDFEAMHPMGAALPEEGVVVLMAFDFKSQVFNYQFNVKGFNEGVHIVTANIVGYEREVGSTSIKIIVNNHIKRIIVFRGIFC